MVTRWLLVGYLWLLATIKHCQALVLNKSSVLHKTSLVYGYSLITRWLLLTIKHFQALILNRSSVLHRMTLIAQLILLNLWNDII